jgi:hypothetical protein
MHENSPFPTGKPPIAPPVLVGTHTFAAKGESARRQAAGVSSLLGLRGAEVVNVQFADHAHDFPEVRTLAVLRETSNGVTGRRGAMKPIMSEIFDALATEASARRLEYFCFTNADILFTQEAIDWIALSGKDSYVLSRQDFDGASGQPTKMEVAGTDVFAMSTAWWARHRAKFRPYIAAEGIWDNVYTAILLCHGDGLLENRRPLVRHEAHPPGPMPSLQFGQYMRMLAAYDARYFSLWVEYWDRLTALRRAGATDAQEDQLAREVFVWAPTLAERALQIGRNVKAKIRYEAWRWRAGAG